MTTSSSSPKTPVSRWFILFLLAFLQFGSYYCYETAAAIPKSLQNLWGSSDSEFSFQIQLINVVYAIPNIILPLVIGVLIGTDKSRLRLYLVLLVLLVACGQLILTAGLPNFPVVLVGRFIFGGAVEALSVVQTSYVSLIFHGKELSFALTMCSIVASLAYISNDFITPTLDSFWGTQETFWFSFGVLIISVVSAFILAFVTRSQLENLKSERGQEEGSEDNNSSEIMEESKDSNPSHFWANFKTLPRAYWLLAALIFVNQGSFAAFAPIQTLFFGAKYFDGDYIVARWTHSIGVIIPLILKPVVSILIDKFGQGVYVMLFAQMLEFLFLSLSFFTYTSPIVLYVLYGIGSCDPSFRYTAIVRLIGKENDSFAIGLAVSILNFGYLLFSLLVGLVASSDGAFTNEFTVFLTASATTVLIVLALVVLNVRKLNRLLSLPESRLSK